MLMDDTDKGVSELEHALVLAGCEVVARVTDPFTLADRVLRHQPDAVIIDSESPSRDVMEQICATHDALPRPIVLFTADRSDDTIRAAIQAGVAAYVVDGMSAERLRPVLDVAIARYGATRRMRDELDQAREELAGRKLVDKAKGILMQQRGLTEAEAYALLRRNAMNRGVRVAQLAQLIIDAASLA
jgi:response regulator NasT